MFVGWFVRSLVRSLFRNVRGIYVKESVTISIYKCLWFEGKIKVGHCSLDSHVSFPE